MSDWPDDQIVLISAIEHFSYCPRQYALIHIEKVFDENIFTLRGQGVHERVHEADSEAEGDAVIELSLPLWSERLGLQGKGDVVEIRSDGTVYPVEYKYGPKRQKQHDDFQLCAQALCLEEMLGRPVPRGAIYHFSSRRRREVEINDSLRTRTEEIIRQLRVVQVAGCLPPPANDGRCTSCSLLDACIPDALVAAREAGASRRLFVPITQEDTK